ncbi:MAG: hypothetical protein JXR77_10830 [Lentisphaeria bacterium]|nr:hypothetical protein [Lentisphaeria bacterium]
MEQGSRAKARVRCPGCERVFEFDPENRGYATTCPKCETEFIIPEEGIEGIPREDIEGTLDVTCPHCRTMFLLPEEHVGEMAECAECHGVFLIPEHGGLGQVVRDDQGEEPEPVVPEKAPPRPSSQPVTEPFLGRPSTLEETAQLRRTATVFLSRKEVLDKATKAQRESVTRLARPEESPAAAAGGGDDGYGEVMSPFARGVIELKTDPVFEPTDIRMVRRSDLPDWMPPLDFGRREKIVEYEEGAERSLSMHRLLTAVPVLLIPVAALLSLVEGVHPAMAGAFCFVAGLACWGVHAVKLLPRLCRRVLILTNFRVIMADTHEVVDIDLL